MKKLLLFVVISLTACFSNAADFIPLPGQSLDQTITYGSGVTSRVVSIVYTNNSSLKQSLTPTISSPYSILLNRCMAVMKGKNCVVTATMSIKGLSGTATPGKNYSTILSAPNAEAVSINTYLITPQSNSQVSFIFEPKQIESTFTSLSQKNILTQVIVKNTSQISGKPEIKITENNSNLLVSLDSCVSSLKPGKTCSYYVSAKQSAGQVKTNKISVSFNGIKQDEATLLVRSFSAPKFVGSWVNAPAPQLIACDGEVVLPAVKLCLNSSSQPANLNDCLNYPTEPQAKVYKSPSGNLPSQRVILGSLVEGCNEGSSDRFIATLNCDTNAHAAIDGKNCELDKRTLTLNQNVKKGSLQGSGGQYDHGAIVNLVYTKSAHAHINWGNACSATTGNNCSVVMDQDKVASIVESCDLNYHESPDKLSCLIDKNTLSIKAEKKGSFSGSIAQDYDFGSQVTVSFSPKTNVKFNWAGDCVGHVNASNQCVLTMDAAKQAEVVTSCETNYHSSSDGSSCEIDQVNLVVTPSLKGSFDKSSSSHNYGSSVEVSFLPKANSHFEWSGDCVGHVNSSNKCELLMTSPKTVSVTSICDNNYHESSDKMSCEIDKFNLVVNQSLKGSFDKSNSSYNYGESVVISFSPKSNSSFQWSGDCVGHVNSSNKCELMMTSSKSVSVASTCLSNYHESADGSSCEIDQFNLVVNSSLKGVFSKPSALYDYGSLVSISFTAKPNSHFSWSGDCLGNVNASNQCNLVMNASKSVSVITTCDLNYHESADKSSCEVDQYNLAVTPSSKGSFSVNSGLYNYGSSVSISFAPKLNSSFTWSGDCVGHVNGSNMCVLSMTSAKTVSVISTCNEHYHSSSDQASCEIDQVQLTVLTPNKGSFDKVSAAYDYGSTVSVLYSPTANSQFTWSGSCVDSVTNPCVLTMTESKVVQANAVCNPNYQAGSGNTCVKNTFELKITQPTLSSITGTVAGFYSFDELKTISYVPVQNGEFVWGGDCAASVSAKDCQVTMSQLRNVSVVAKCKDHFNEVAGGCVSEKIRLEITTPSMGSITGLAPGIYSYDYGTNISLTYNKINNSEFTWSVGPCQAFANNCSFTLTAASVISINPVCSSGYALQAGACVQQSVTVNPTAIELSYLSPQLPLSYTTASPSIDLSKIAAISANAAPTVIGTGAAPPSVPTHSLSALPLAAEVLTNKSLPPVSLALTGTSTIAAKTCFFQGLSNIPCSINGTSFSANIYGSDLGTSTALNLMVDNTLKSIPLSNYEISQVSNLKAGQSDSMGLNGDSSLFKFNNESYSYCNDKLCKVTPTGMIQLTNFNAATSPDYLSRMYELESNMYFSLNSGISKLYKIDSLGNITQISNLKGTGVTDSINIFGVFNKELYFAAPQPSSTAVRLFKYNPLTNTIYQVSNINATSDAPTLAFITDDEIYFNSFNASGRTKLYKINKSGVLTQVSNINAATINDNASAFYVVDKTVYFSANKATSGSFVYKVFKLNITTGAITQISNINTGSGSPDVPSNPSFTLANGQVYFVAYNNSIVDTYRKLYRINTANDVVSQVTNYRGNASTDGPVIIAQYNNELYFTAYLPTNATGKLIKIKTTGEVVQVSNINTVTAGSDSIIYPVIWDNSLFFVSSVNNAGTYKLFRLNSSGITQMMNLNSAGTDNISRVSVYGDDLYVMASNSTGLTKLYKIKKLSK